MAGNGVDVGAAASGSHVRAAEALARAARTTLDRARDFVVPGRIEVLGKHTDYAGGSTMTCASSRAIRMLARPREDGLVCLHDPRVGRYAALEAGGGAEAPAGHWSAYAAATIRRVARNAPGRLRGVDLWLSSNLPRAAGMSSSSAFVVAVFLGLDAVCDFRGHEGFAEAVPDLEALAGYVASIENGRSFRTLEGETGVGTLGGSEDHVAILLSRSGHIGRYRYAPFEREGSLPLPAGHVLAVAASGVVAMKTGSAREAYNAAARLARDGVRRWEETTGDSARHLGDLAERGDGSLQRLIDAGGEIGRRVEHFRVEHARVIPEAWEALEAGDLVAFGDAVDRSQRAAEDLLGNQVPETVHLASSARRLGAVAASAFGAGFGGSVWALVSAGQAGTFLRAWQSDYLSAWPRRARRAGFFLEPTGPGARHLDGTPVW